MIVADIVLAPVVKYSEEGKISSKFSNSILEQKRQ